MKYSPNLSIETLEEERHRFAAWVVDLAATCRDNAELLQRMTASLPPDFLKLTGEGTTRRCYSTLLGVAVKVQREAPADDPLDDVELEFRGGPSYLTELWGRRRGGNICEIQFSVHWPRLAPRVYGFLAATGLVQRHPSIIVAETARPLDHIITGGRFGVFTEDMGVDAAGHLWVFDSRLTNVKKPAHLLSLAEAIRGNEAKIQLGNIGVTPAGHYVFLDRSDHGGLNKGLLNPLTLCPPEWGWTFAPTPAQDLEFSQTILASYLKAERNIHV